MSDPSPDAPDGALPPRHRAPRSRLGARMIVVAAVIVLAAGVGWMMLPIDAWLRRFADWVNGFGALSGVIYVGVYLLGAAAMVPGAVLSMGAGLVFGLFGIVIALIGAPLGATGAFLISRYLARDYVGARVRRHRRFAAVDRAIAEEGWKVVVLMRLSPMPYSFSNYLFGATRIRFWSYVAGTVVGVIPWTVALVWIGAAGRTAFASLGHGGSTTEWILLGAGVAASVVMAVLITRAARRRLARSGLDH